MKSSSSLSKWAAILLALILPLGYPTDDAGLTFGKLPPELEVSKTLFFLNLGVTRDSQVTPRVTPELPLVLKTGHQPDISGSLSAITRSSKSSSQHASTVQKACVLCRKTNNWKPYATNTWDKVESSRWCPREAAPVYSSLSVSLVDGSPSAMCTACNCSASDLTSAFPSGLSATTRRHNYTTSSTGLTVPR